MEELTPLLEKLADKLGTTTEHLWGVLVKQSLFVGISDLILWLVVVAFVTVELKWYKYFRINYKELHNNDVAFVHELGLVIYAVFTVIFIMIAVVSLPTTLAAFFNPEYWALKEILGSLNR